MAEHAITRGKLLNFLTEEAREYRKDALSSLEWNRHMNNLSSKDISKMKKERQRHQRIVDALLVDFINTVGANQGVDYALYTKHFKKD